MMKNNCVSLQIEEVSKMIRYREKHESLLVVIIMIHGWSFLAVLKESRGISNK